MWTVKCRIGTEKETVMLLMRKFISLKDSDTVRSYYFIVCDSVLYVLKIYAST